MENVVVKNIISFSFQSHTFFANRKFKIFSCISFAIDGQRVQFDCFNSVVASDDLINSEQEYSWDNGQIEHHERKKCKIEKSELEAMAMGIWLGLLQI